MSELAPNSWASLRLASHCVAARSQLDEVTFAKVWAEDRALTLEQAVEYALEDLDG